MSLAHTVGDILGAIETAGSEEVAARARDARDRLDQPLRVAVAGRVKAGKSTLLNALMGEALAATDAAECTRLVTWYRHHPQYAAVAVHTDSRRSPLVLDRSDGGASIDVSAIDERSVSRLEVGVPSAKLEQLMLIDTPGLDSITEGVSERSHQFIAPQPGDQGADVLVFLMRYLHSEDAEFLEAFADPAAPSVDLVRAVAVLSRADELGSGRGDGLLVADEVAGQYRRHPHLRRMVSEVYPVSGLLAFYAASGTQREFDQLAELADLPSEDLDRLLVSAHRFGADTNRLRSSGPQRAALVERLGLPGVRMAVVAIRGGVVANPRDLALLLEELSGIEPLRRMLLERFASRAATLKAARALDLAEHLARDLGANDARRIGRRIERARLDAHELRELDAIRLLLERDSDRVCGLSVDDLLQYLGHRGDAVGQRLAPAVERATGSLSLPDLVQDLRTAASAGYASRHDQDIVLTAATSIENVYYRVRAARDEAVAADAAPADAAHGRSDEALTEGEGDGV
ncbi:MAG: dynamin family protein [Actinomycetota bacterium]